MPYLQRFTNGVNNYFPSYDIQDDEFAVLVNAVPRRGDMVKKLGSALLGILQQASTQDLGSTDSSGDFNTTLTPIGSGIVPSSIELTIGSSTFNDNGSGSISPYASINYVTGSLLITSATATAAVSIVYSYYPGNPVMGIGTLQALELLNPITLVVMDTTTAYGFNYGSRQFFSISTYAMTSSTPNPVTWHGADYQQFNFCNFQDCLFLTNNIPGMQYKFINSLSAVTTTVTVGVTNHGLIVGDQIFFYEVGGMTQINGLVGTVTSIIDVNDFVCTVPNLVSPSPYTTGGIVQYLTSSVPFPVSDGIRLYVNNPSFQGFQNFAPPLYPSNVPGVTVQYLVGAKLMIEYGNRLLAMGCYIQTSDGTSTYLPNAIYWSQINSALYTQDPSAWYVSPAGSGGFLILGGNQPIIFAEKSAETLIVALQNSYRKVITTGITILPFEDYPVSVEYGSICPFGYVVLRNAILGIDSSGITAATPNVVDRIDNTKIPDAVAKISGSNNGFLRVCSGRSYKSQLLFFSYPEESYIFPNRSIVYNLVDQSWSYYVESYTCYGQYVEQQSSRTWANAGTWADAGTWGDTSGTQFTKQLAGGNPQGAVLLKDGSTFNEPCMPILSMSGSTLVIPNHNLLAGYFLFITSCIGNTILNGTNVMVLTVVDSNTVTISTDVGADVYIGGGLAAIVDNFAIVTKSYTMNWEARQGTTMLDFQALFGITTAGQLSAYFSPDLIPPSPYLDVSSIKGASVIYTMPNPNYGLTGTEYQQSYAWKNLPNPANGIAIQLVLFLSKEQMFDVNITQSSMILGALRMNMTDQGKVIS